MTATPSPFIVQAFPEQWLVCPSPFLHGRNKVVDRLFYGVFHHRRTQLLSGPDGAGKSIALQRLQWRLHGRRTLVTLDGADIDGDQGLLLALCNALAQQPRPARTIVNACLQARLKTLAEQDLAVVLLIDNGDTLSDEALNTIREWSRADSELEQYPLTVIVSCRPPLAERLATDPRYWVEVALKPLSLVGTGRYLQQRISRAGIRAPGPFDRAATKAIQRQSGGWPGAIDVLARDLLQQDTHSIRRYRRAPRAPDKARRQPRRNLSGLLLVLLLTLLAWWYRTPLLERPVWENRDRAVAWLQEQGQTLVQYLHDDTKPLTIPAMTSNTPTTRISSLRVPVGDGSATESGYTAHPNAAPDHGNGARGEER
jgi:type II secretory pathway predicted ATPase ExeA